jgi:hypothetical protein
MAKHWSLIGGVDPPQRRNDGQCHARHGLPVDGCERQRHRVTGAVVVVVVVVVVVGSTQEHSGANVRT